MRDCYDIPRKREDWFCERSGCERGRKKGERGKMAAGNRGSDAQHLKGYHETVHPGYQNCPSRLGGQLAGPDYSGSEYDPVDSLGRASLKGRRRAGNGRILCQIAKRIIRYCEESEGRINFTAESATGLFS